MSRTIHIAGAVVQVGSVSRQRCAWCGEMLAELDRNNTAVAPNEDGTYPELTCGFEPLKLISVEGINPTSYGVVEHTDGEQIPAGFCGDDGPRLKVVAP